MSNLYEYNYFVRTLREFKEQYDDLVLLRKDEVDSTQDQVILDGIEKELDIIMDSALVVFSVAKETKIERFDAEIEYWFAGLKERKNGR